MMKQRDLFEFGTIRTLAERFSLATGLSCNVITPDDTVGFTCAFCRAMGKAGYGMNCHSIHTRAMNEARQFGGQYIFMCPFDLVHIVCPVVTMGQTTAALLAGPFLTVEQDDFLEAISAKYGLTPAVAEAVSALPQVDTKRVTALAEILQPLAESIGDSRGFAAEREIALQQKEISSYIHYFKEEEDRIRYPVDVENGLLAAIEQGDEARTRQLLNELLGVILLKSGSDLDAIRERVIDLVVLLSRSAIRGGADCETVFATIHEYSKTIQSFRSFDELVYWLANIIQDFVASVLDLDNKDHGRSLHRAIDYMRKHYMNKLTLEEVAAYVHFTPTYFSKIFKEEVGQRFSDYLNEIRIEQAKTFLKTEFIPIVDIAAYTGFSDQSYFNKVFKKHTGLTPKKYREYSGTKK